LGALALRNERQSAQMSKIKNSGLDQYGPEPFEQQQFGTAGIEGFIKQTTDNYKIGRFHRTTKNQPIFV